VVILNNMGPQVAEEGLKYVHNDTCYPALLVIGQMIDALNSGKYDLDSTALMITQTGGGCRASNYIHLLRKALRKAGYENIPVISLNISGLEKDCSFKLTLPMLVKMIAAFCYGDLLMLLHNQTEPYEITKGSSQKIVDKWVKKLSDQLVANKGWTRKAMQKNMHAILEEYAAVKRDMTPKVKVGVVGEIYVKYSALANNQLEAFLRSQDCEVNVPGILGFAFFKVDNRIEDIKLYGGNPLKMAVCNALMDILGKNEKMMLDCLAEFPQFHAPAPYKELKKMVEGVIGYGAKMGEGWLLTAEMVELIHSGYGNIVCAQPFGCLPNHIVGKGMIRRLRQLYPKSNIVPIDYDPGATRVNQENRIKLMLAVAKENLDAATSDTAPEAKSATNSESESKKQPVNA
ncbi:MAG: 2-hydroxyacyl-CoA dehydratase, partial [Clostridia bacterium]|nr:2-hydroxyacyl-CoA dehydratase [Clostridia bacterium]